MRSKTWVGIFFIAAALVVALVLRFALQSLFAALKVTDTHVLGDQVTLSLVLAILVAAIVSIGLFMWQKTNTFVTQVVEELNKVNWPSWGETKVNTLVVIVTSVIAALILGTFDITFGYASTWLSDHF